MLTGTTTISYPPGTGLNYYGTPTISTSIPSFQQFERSEHERDLIDKHEAAVKKMLTQVDDLISIVTKQSLQLRTLSLYLWRERADGTLALYKLSSDIVNLILSYTDDIPELTVARVAKRKRIKKKYGHV